MVFITKEKGKNFFELRLLVIFTTEENAGRAAPLIFLRPR